MFNLEILEIKMHILFHYKCQRTAGRVSALIRPECIPCESFSENRFSKWQENDDEEFTASFYKRRTDVKYMCVRTDGETHTAPYRRGQIPNQVCCKQPPDYIKTSDIITDRQHNYMAYTRQCEYHCIKYKISTHILAKHFTKDVL